MFKNLILRPREFYKNFHLVRNEKHVIALLVLAGIAKAFDKAIENNRGDDWELQSVIGFSIIIGGLLGWISFYIYGAIISWTSEWFGSEISTKSVIAIMAYALVPMIISLIVLVPQILIYGNTVFQSEFLNDGNSIKFYLYWGLFALQALLSFYSIILFIVGLSEVGKITLGKAILVALSPLLFFMAIGAILMAINLFTS